MQIFHEFLQRDFVQQNEILNANLCLLCHFGRRLFFFFYLYLCAFCWCFDGIAILLSLLRCYRISLIRGFCRLVMS